MKTFCLLLMFIASVQAFAENAALYRLDGSKIDYYFNANKSKTLFVIAQGSECKSVKHNRLITERFKLTRPNADFLTVEKYDITPSQLKANNGQCSNLHYAKDNPEQRANDYISVIENLNENYNYQRIVMLGGSEGALVAALVASRSSLISDVVMINGGGQFFIDDILHNMKSTLPADVYSQARQGILNLRKAVLANKSVDMPVSGHGLSWWRSMFQADLYRIVSEINVPTLILQSALDESVSPLKVTELVSKLSDKKPNVSYQELSQLNHGLKDVKGVDHSLKVVARIQSWLKNSINSSL